MAVIDTTGGSSEFQVNTAIPNDQLFGVVAALAGGGWVIVWQSYTAGIDWEIRGQRYAADGSRAGNEFAVNTYTTSQQEAPSITALTDGSFVVAWQSQGQDAVGTSVYARRFLADGTGVGNEFRVNTTADPYEDDPDIAALASGGYVVTWARRNVGDIDVYQMRFDVTGNPVGTETRVNTDQTGTHSLPAVAALTGGGHVVVWNGPDSSNSGIYAQRFDATGAAAGTAIAVNQTTDNSQSEAQVAELGGGGFVVVWRSDVGADQNVYARRFAADGSAVGGEFRVNTTVPDTQLGARVAGLSDGGFVVLWQSIQNGSTSSYDVYAQRYAANGAPLGGETLMNTTLTGMQFSPDAAALPGGGYVATWSSPDASERGIFSRVVPVAGTTITGTASDDTIIVSSASVVQTTTIDGGAGTDVLRTGDASLSLSGITLTSIESITTTNTAGTRLMGSAGNDTFDGAGRYDTMVYSGVRREHTSSGNLASSSVSGPQGTDTLTNVEEIAFRDGRFVRDVDSYAAMVWRFYSIGLDRQADSAGFNHWLADMERTRLPFEVARAMVRSQEFADKYGALDNTAFVTAMYQNGLDRAPDASGLLNWLNYLNGGGNRAFVLQAFANSAEAVAKTRPEIEAGLWDLNENAMIIARIYDAAFGRRPTRAEFATGMDQLDAGTTFKGLAAQVAATGAFTTLYGALSNDAYVEALYTTALGRAADPAGKSGWVGLLNGGTARSDVLFDIANSWEHEVRHQPAIQDGIRFDGETLREVGLSPIP